MKKSALILFSTILFCCNTSTKGKFIVNGEIKNAPDQKIYLEEIFFSKKPPQVIDTVNMIKGKFSVKGIANEEGLYRLRLEKSFGYIFINDNDQINFTADANDSTVQGPSFNSPANASLKKFIIIMDSLQSVAMIGKAKMNVLSQSNSFDSALQVEQKRFAENELQYKTFLLNYIDTTASPMVALFGLGYSQGITEDMLTKSVTGLSKRFPKHSGVAEVINQYNEILSQSKNSPAPPAPAGGSLMAPEITLPDTEGNLFSLSSLRGKFVLIDFWASWCGPCRQENPNVVSAFHKFKAKNFTVLGVSLDKEKSDWMQAIREDGLTWKHISDLKFWNSAVVPLYNIEGIPYNVLINPKGEIIANSLRGKDLENKLTEVLK